MEEKAGCKKNSSLLIVEDDESQLRTLTDIMQEEGFEVIGCSTASEALEHLDHLETGVVVLDQRLPDLSGTQLLERLAVATDRIRVIINTAYSSYELVKDALNLGAFAYVEKMDNPEELLRQVHRAFEASLRSYADELETVVAERTQEMRRANELLRKEVAEREREEQLLQKEKDKAQKYLDVAGVMLVAIDSEQRVGLINKKGCEILGYKEEEILAKNWFDNFLPERIRDEVKAVFEKNVQAETQAPEYYENPILTKDGQERLISWHNTILRDEKGDVIATLSSGEDITERRKSEEALRESEEKYRVLFENAGEGIITLDLDGRITGANRLVEEYGFNRAELLGRRLFDFVPEYDQARSISDFQALVEGRRVQGEMDIITLKGIITVEYRDTPIVREGEVIGVQAILTDITERKKAVEALRESEEKFKSIFEHANDGVIYLDSSGNILDINEKAAQMFGGPKQQAVNRHFTEVGVFSADEIPTLMSNFEKIFAGEEVVLTVPIRNKKGRELILECSASVAKTDDGAGRIMVIARDITERKKAEEQITKLAKFPAEDPDPVLRISGYGTVIYANKASAALLKAWDCRVGESLPDQWQGFVLDALSSGQSQQTETQCDGRIFSLTFAPVVEANYVNVYGHDITKRKKTEQALWESQERYRALIENTLIGIVVLDTNYKIIMVNSVVAGLFKKPASDFVGKYCFREFEKREAVCSHCPGERAIASGKTEEVETQGVRDDGSRFYVRNRAVPFFGPDGVMKGFIEMIEDITERKQTEKELIENQAKLKAMASKMLMTEERERQHLAVGLHDEVCQKLVLTKLALESSMNLVSDPNVSASLRIVCEGIGETIEKADSLTFEFSNPVLREFGFVVALEKYLAEEILQKYGIAYELQGEKQLGTLQDEIKNCLYHVTRELLTNVVKHAHASKINVSVRKDCGRIYVSVQDNGVGFKDSEDSEKVSRTTRFGLFSIREQLEYLGGHLEIDSEPGRGTTATIVVPLRKRAID